VHTLWLVNVETSNKIVEEFKNVEATYVADGHHRAAASFNVGKKRREDA